MAEVGPANEVMECLVVFRASGAEDAVRVAERLVRERGGLGGGGFRFVRFIEISMIDDAELEDGAELLYFEYAYLRSGWVRMVKARGELAIFCA